MTTIKTIPRLVGLSGKLIPKQHEDHYKNLLILLKDNYAILEDRLVNVSGDEMYGLLKLKYADPMLQLIDTADSNYVLELFKETTNRLQGIRGQIGQPGGTSNIGGAATNRAAASTLGFTWFDLNTPATSAGSLTDIALWVNNAIGNWKIKVFRISGSDVIFVGESEEFTVTGSFFTRSLTSPITGVQIGDYIGFYADHASARLDRDNAGGSGIYYITDVSSDITADTVIGDWTNAAGLIHSCRGTISSPTTIIKSVLGTLQDGASAGEEGIRTWGVAAGSHKFLGQVIADLVFNGSYTATGLRAPSANGEAIRQTAKISEEILEAAHDTINSGMLTAIVVTDEGGINISWAAGTIWDGTAKAVVTIALAGSTACTDDALNYLYWDRSGGGTALTLSTTPPDTDDNDVRIASIYVQDGDIYDLEPRAMISSRETEISAMLTGVFPALVESGLIVSEHAGDDAFDVDMTAGVWWHLGHHRQAVSAFDSTVTDIRRWYHDGGGNWISDTNSQIDATQYDTGTGLAANTAAKYYRSLFFVVGGTLHWVYPTTAYNTVAQAIAGADVTMPNALSTLPRSTALVLKGNAAALPTAGGDQWIDVRPKIGATGGGSISDHGELAGLGDNDHDAVYITKALLTTEGDIIFRNATVPARLAKGAALRVLRQNAGLTAPEWALVDLTSMITGLLPAANLLSDIRIKGWIVFNGTGVIAIRDSYNVSGIVDNGVGDYAVTWDNDFDTIDYSVSGLARTAFLSISPLQVGSMSVYAKQNATLAPYDSDTICVQAWGGDS